jgi:DNA mismatch repair protein MutL
LLRVEFTSTIQNDRAEEEEDSSFRLWGLIGRPGVSRSARDEQFVFVNRRPVENRGVNFALIEGYHTSLMKGRYPVCCLFLEIDPAAVDVNIHPSKREVKFRQEKVVRQLVAQAVRETLLGFHTAKPRESLAPVQTPKAIVESPKSAEFPQFTAFTGTPLETKPKTEPDPKPLPIEKPVVAAGPPAEPAVLRPMAQPPPAPIAPPAAVPLLAVPLRLIGVIGRLYVVLESDRGLVLMDQHAEHERILFEQMLSRMEQGNAPSQRLLLPETVELSARDAQFLRELLTTLNRLGVGLSEFGERTFLLDALPPFVKASDPRRFTLGLIDELKAAGQEVNTLRLGEHTVAKTVCRHAVKANDALSGPELENLVKDLRQCAMPYTCPHGRPTLIEMSYRELEKKFGRLAG